MKTLTECLNSQLFKAPKDFGFKKMYSLLLPGVCGVVSDDGYVYGCNDTCLC